MSKTEPLIVDSAGWRDATASCGLCDLGHRRINGIHVPTQRVGMIPAAPCTKIAAVRGVSGMWFDGDVVRDEHGVRRDYTTAHYAYRRARQQSHDQGAT